MANRLHIARETAPALEVLTLSEAKDYLKVEGSDDDALITNLIKAVRESAEKFLKISMINQSWKLLYDDYTPSFIELPMAPVQSITNVMAYARDGSSNVISSGAYYLSASNTRLVFDANVISHRIEIVYVAGYGAAASDVPDPIKQGMLSHIASIYDGRSGKNVIPPQAMILYAPYRAIFI